MNLNLGDHRHSISGSCNLIIIHPAILSKMYPIKGNTAEKWHNGHCQVFISHCGTGIANQF